MYMCIYNHFPFMLMKKAGYMYDHVCVCCLEHAFG